MDNKKLKETIISVVEDFFEDELEIEFDKSVTDCKLFGGDGPLDSMSLVTLLVNLEEVIEDEFNISLVLANEKAMSRRTSPFSRLNYLIDFILEEIQNSNEK
ncbi:MAG: hypothetical protein CL869_00080 [Cytophagia bacterium]|nr:hypothetical protein [Cytophagia bacterium]